MKFTEIVRYNGNDRPSCSSDSDEINTHPPLSQLAANSSVSIGIQMSSRMNEYVKSWTHDKISPLCSFPSKDHDHSHPNLGRLPFGHQLELLRPVSLRRDSLQCKYTDQDPQRHEAQVARLHQKLPYTMSLSLVVEKPKIFRDFIS